MFKVSDIISTPVISLYESEFQGIIYNIMFDVKLKKCKYLCVLNEEDGIQRMLKIKDIYQVGSECIFIRNESALELECNYESEIGNYNNPLNLKVYNMNGKFLGTSSDIILDDKFNIQSIVLNNGEVINNENIFNLGRTIILVDNINVSIAKFRPKQKTIPNKSTENKVIILSDLREETKKSTASKDNNSINKIITDFRFLVGRILNKDIIAINGEMIAKNGSTITKDIVNKASFYGKLVEVARYSKKTNL
ncbi:MAG: PRC-barrel domain-containing protein [Christensenellales bacterium]